jgi:hypothetical protein
VRWPWGWRPWTWWPRATASTSSCAHHGKVDRPALLQIIWLNLRFFNEKHETLLYEGIWSQTTTTSYFHQETRRCSNFYLKIFNLIELIFHTTAYVLKAVFLNRGSAEPLGSVGIHQGFCSHCQWLHIVQKDWLFKYVFKIFDRF